MRSSVDLPSVDALRTCVLISLYKNICSCQYNDGLTSNVFLEVSHDEVHIELGPNEKLIPGTAGITVTIPKMLRTRLGV